LRDVFATYKPARSYSPKRSPAQTAERFSPGRFNSFSPAKLHPRDEGGSADSGSLQILALNPVSIIGSSSFEDYDTYIARRLVQAVDLWLNNPLRPLEASGTSGK